MLRLSVLLVLVLGAPAWAGKGRNLPAAEQVQLDAAGVLEAAIRAHGGSEGGAVVLGAAPAVKLEYRRTVPNGPTVRHIYARRGQDVYLSVDVEKGEGVSSRSGVAGGKAWLAAAGAAPAAQDLDRTREALGRFGPEAVLSFPLGFARAMHGGSEALELREPTEVDGRRCLVIGHSGDRVSDPVTIAVDAEDHLVRRVTFASDAGDLTHELSGWKTVHPSLVVPSRIRTWRGDDLVDEVEILEITVDRTLPEEWFQVHTP